MSYKFEYAWKASSNCNGVGTEMSFSIIEVDQLAFANEFCQDCPVKVQCLEAGKYEFFGVWGGLSEKQRVRVHRKRGRFTDVVENQTW